MHPDPGGERTKERGASAVEYALLVSFIAAIIVGATAALGVGVLGLFGDSCNEVANAINGSTC
jgi:Flp pilus assembly pilin Flp